MSRAGPLFRAGQEAVLATLGLLYPPVCAICDSVLGDSSRGERFVCEACSTAIDRLPNPLCHVCGDPLGKEGIDLCEVCAHERLPFAWARSVAWYDGVLARLILHYKYEREHALVHVLAPMLSAYLLEHALLGEIDALSFVPMSQRRIRARGFNHARLLAKRVARIMQRPVVAPLRKIRETRPQMQLTSLERRVNLQGAFAASPPDAYRRILLVDDVYTTGATARECSRALSESGWQRVMVLTLARTPISHQHEQFSESEPDAS